MVLDKGCLDAIYPELNEENTKNIEKFFTGVWNVLKINGSYFVISLF